MWQSLYHVHKSLHGISTIHPVTEAINSSPVFVGFGVVFIQFEYKRQKETKEQRVRPLDFSFIGIIEFYVFVCDLLKRGKLLSSLRKYLGI